MFLPVFIFFYSSSLIHFRFFDEMDLLAAAAAATTAAAGTTLMLPPTSPTNWGSTTIITPHSIELDEAINAPQSLLTAVDPLALNNGIQYGSITTAQFLSEVLQLGSIIISFDQLLSTSWSCATPKALYQSTVVAALKYGE